MNKRQLKEWYYDTAANSYVTPDPKFEYVEKMHDETLVLRGVGGLIHRQICTMGATQGAGVMFDALVHDAQEEQMFVYGENNY